MEAGHGPDPPRHLTPRCRPAGCSWPGMTSTRCAPAPRRSYSWPVGWILPRGADRALQLATRCRRGDRAGHGAGSATAFDSQGRSCRLLVAGKTSTRDASAALLSQLAGLPFAGRSMPGEILGAAIVRPPLPGRPFTRRVLVTFHHAM